MFGYCNFVTFRVLLFISIWTIAAFTRAGNLSDLFVSNDPNKNNLVENGYKFFRVRCTQPSNRTFILEKMCTACLSKFQAIDSFTEHRLNFIEQFLYDRLKRYNINSAGVNCTVLAVLNFHEIRSPETLRHRLRCIVKMFPLPYLNRSNLLDNENIERRSNFKPPNRLVDPLIKHAPRRANAKRTGLQIYPRCKNNQRDDTMVNVEIASNPDKQI